MPEFYRGVRHFSYEPVHRLRDSARITAAPGEAVVWPRASAGQKRPGHGARKRLESVAGEPIPLFGRFVTYEDQTPPYVIHSQQGATTPGTYSEQQRFYQFTGDVLRLGGPPNLNDAGELAGGHLYWQKMKAGER